jgi:integrase
MRQDQHDPRPHSTASQGAEGQGARQGALFTAWRSVRPDLADACERAGIERCSPNDLRRTFASWQVEAGVPLFPIAQAMGH